MLRRWQERFVEHYFEKNQSDYLLEATPGAGKTLAAAAVSSRALRARLIDRVIFVVPRLPLKPQVAKAVHGLGVDLRPGWKPADAWPVEANGIVITYQTLASQPALLRLFSGQASTMFIFDEAHHGGDDSTWGTAMRTAAEEASYRLLTSGTPFRTSGTAIPFVTYVDGEAQPDYAYGYGQALGDEIVRAVNFPRRGGPMRWRLGTEHHTADLQDSSLSDEHSRQALRTAVDPEQDWVRAVLTESTDLLRELRSTDPQAGGNYQATTISAAQKVAVQLRTLVGSENVVLATSKDAEGTDAATAAIDRFRHGSAMWLVSCDMVTEGIDIPRLRVLVYAKTDLTALAFRQAVGRVVRRPDDHDYSYVFIPDHPTLRALAEEIEDQINAWLKEETEEVLREFSDEAMEPRLFIAEAAEATDEGTIRAGDHYTADEWARAKHVQLQNDVTVGMDTTKVILLLRSASVLPGVTPPPPREVEPPYQAQERLRKQNNQLAKRIAYVHGYEHAQVNQTANMAVGIRRLADASNDELKRRLEILRDWLATGLEPCRNVG